MTITKMYLTNVSYILTLNGGKFKVTSYFYISLSLMYLNLHPLT